MRIVAYAAAASFALAVGPAKAQSVARPVDGSTHERCVSATDYKGCLEAQGENKTEEQLKTGIVWDSAKWVSTSVVRLNVYRMRGGGIWVGSAMRLSVMEVDCATAEFDVESDGYSKQPIGGDAWRQALLIYSRLCQGIPKTAAPIPLSN